MGFPCTMAHKGFSTGSPQAAAMGAAASSGAARARRWSTHRLAGTLGPHLAAWNGLNARRFDGHPLLTGAFVDGLLRHFGEGTEHLCVLEVDGVVEAMCVLQPSSRWQWTTFRPPQAQVGCLLLADQGALAGLLESLPGWVVALDLMCVDPRVSGQLTAPSPSFQRHHAQTMTVVMHGYSEYLANRSGKLRNNLRRYAKKIDADGQSIRYEVITDPTEVGSAVVRYAQLESRGWKAASGTALDPSGDQIRFYAGLLVAAAQRRESSVHEMWIGSTLAASRLALRSEHMTVMLKTTYDETLARYAPGRLLLAEALRVMADRGKGHAVEFYTDASADQLAWATDSRSIYDMRLYRGGLIGLAAHAAHCVLHLWRDPATARTVDEVQVDRLGSLGEAPSDVTELFDELVPAHGTQAGAAWFEMLQRHCFADDDCAVFVLRHRGTPVAALPLRRAGARVESLANAYSATYAPPIAPWLKACDLRPLLRAVRAHWPQAASFCIEPMDQSSQAYRLLQEALEDDGCVTLRLARHVNWTWPRAAGVGWPQYLAARPGEVRTTLARATRRFASRGGRIEIIAAGERLAAGIAAYEAVYAASWKRRESFPAFVRELMEHSARRGSLRLGIAWLDAVPVAAQLWIVIDGRAEIFKLAYDERHKALSPGTLLTAHMVQRAIEDDDVSVIDFLTGDDRYKASWMAQRDTRWSLFAHDARRLRGCVALLRALPGAILRALGARRAGG